MRKAVLTLVFLALSLLMGAQEKPTEKAYKRDGNAFVQSVSRTSSNDIATAYVWRDSKGNEYPIFLHKYVKGEKVGRYTAYVIRTSRKTGKEYKYYIPQGEQIATEILNESK